MAAEDLMRSEASISSESEVSAACHGVKGDMAMSDGSAGKHTIHGRDKQHDTLGVHAFPYSTLMGDWKIVGSSLALWKNRSDVLCRYTPHDVPESSAQALMRESEEKTMSAVDSGNSKTRAAREALCFSDEIWWEQLDRDGNHQPGKGAARDRRSIVRGRNRLDASGQNDATFFWRGYNFLKPFTSRWQILAYSDNLLEPETTEPIWLVTYFTATLFTRAGIDLYVRGTLPNGAYEDIVERLKRHPGDDVESKELRALAEEMFEIPTGNLDE